jgi:hypothetical protein
VAGNPRNRRQLGLRKDSIENAIDNQSAKLPAMGLKESQIAPLLDLGFGYAGTQYWRFSGTVA